MKSLFRIVPLFLILSALVSAGDAVPPIRVNEILSSEDKPLEDSIELFNPTAAAVSVAGWFLTDDLANPKAFRIPDGTMIPANGFVVILERDFGAAFKLSADGDQLFLYSADAAGNLTGYSHGFGFGAAENGVSFGRVVNSIGEERFVAQSSRTLGSVNSGPKVGPVVINELMYNPGKGGDEFVELRNLTSAPVKLFDPVNPANTWKISGIGFTMPANVEIPAKGFLLIVKIDPAGFRSKYLISADVPILGPYTGSLSSTTDTIELFKPGVPNATTTGTDVPQILVDAVTYTGAAPWPASANGNGPSLERIDGFAYADDPANWRASAVIGGTPGRGASVDTDKDGITDDVDDDDDNDGMPDVMELAAGTNPLDPNSKPGGTADFDVDGIVDDMDPDDDNDGVSDLNEIADGTNPYDAKSFLRVPMTIIKLSGSVRFSDGSGKSVVSGAIENLPAGFIPLGATAKANIGGAVTTFTFGKTPKARNETGSIALNMKLTKNAAGVSSFVGGRVPFKLVYQKGMFATTWASLGVDPNVSKTQVPLDMPVELTVAGRVFSANAGTVYTSVAHKTGKFTTDLPKK